MLCITLPMGLLPMCWGMLANSIISLVINTHYTGRLIHLGFLAQMRDLLPSLALSMAAGAAVHATVTFIPMHPGLALAAGVIEGAAIYSAIARLLRFKEFAELMSIIRRK